MGASTKVTTVIENATEQGMTVKVGNRNCYAKLTSVKVGAHYRMHLDINWTYQEFLLQGHGSAAPQLLLNSDDCCDYERITVIQHPDGHFDVQKGPRGSLGQRSVHPILEIQTNISNYGPEVPLANSGECSAADSQIKQIGFSWRSFMFWL